MSLWGSDPPPKIWWAGLTPIFYKEDFTMKIIKIIPILIILIVVTVGIFFIFRNNTSTPKSLPLVKAPKATMYWNKEKQTMQGFGISEAFHQANNIKNFPEASKTEILDLLFSTTKGAGLSIVRNIVGDGGTWGNAIDGPTPSIEPAPGTWNWQGDEEQIWFMNQAKNYGCNTFISTVWSPPAWMKTNNSVTKGGSVKESKYQAFADYLSKYCSEYKTRFGVDIYAISLQNEPGLVTDYSSCIWSGEQFNKFIKGYLAPTFLKDGIKTKVILGEDNNFTEAPAVSTLNDPIASNRVDIVAAHAYDYNVLPFPVSTSKGKSIWQTEVSNMKDNDASITDGLKWAKMINDQITQTGVNAWLYWWGACYKTDGESLINMDVDKQTYSINKRLYTIGNFSRFIRPGYKLIDSTTNPAEGVYISTYKDSATGKFAIVVINQSSSQKNIDMDFDGVKTTSLSPYRTSATEDLLKLPDLKVTGKSASFVLEAESVTTYVGSTK